MELYIKRGFLEQHLKKNTKYFWRKNEFFMLNELTKIEHIKILNFPRGGYFIWIELANYIDEENFIINAT